MKILKVLSASAVAAALAASMCVTASAATYGEVGAAAENAGAPSTKAQEFENYLEKNDALFSEDDYDSMITDIEALSEEYFVPAATALGYTDISVLTDAQKVEVFKSMSDEERAAFAAAINELAEEYGVDARISADGTVIYSETPSTSDTDSTSATDSDSSSNASSSSAAAKSDSAVAATGGEIEAGSNATAIAFGGIATLLAASGIIVVAKKNRD